MGVQTFNNDVLRRVHRRHTGEQALDACRKLAASGLMVNIDLMYGLPGQSREIFHDDFAMVASEKVGCVTAYNLRVNEETPVRRLLKDHERLELGRLAVWRGFVRDTARQLGYEQPHWQRFMLPDTQFELELTTDNLYGLGVSARSFLDNAVYRNHTKLSRYVQRVESGSSPVQEVFPLSLEHQKTYFITRSLGAGKQLDYRIYEERFGRRFWQDYGEVCQPLLDTGALEEDGDRLAIYPMGALLYDRVTLAFYPEVLLRWLQGRHEKAMRGRVA
jgi:oxygen-independent coproporphyrinogen-3 oxidase